MSEAIADTGTSQATQALVADAAAAAADTDMQMPAVIDRQLNTSEVTIEEEVTKVDLDLPMAMGTPDLDVPGSKWKIFLYSVDCITCDALNPWVPDEIAVDGAAAKCHFRRNNPYCPAAQIETVTVGTKMRALRMLRKAMAESAENPMKMAETIVKLTNLVKDKKLTTDELAQVYQEAGLTSNA